jgi:hypothetical protein
MDVLYVLKRDNSNYELRYSLRSLENYDHDRVWVSGFKPKWMQNVEFIPTKQTGTRFENAIRNLIAALKHPEFPDEFLFMNDDFFIMQRFDSFPVWNEGPLHNKIQTLGHSQYNVLLKYSMQYLKDAGVAEPLSFELHKPMPMNKNLMLEFLMQSGAAVNAIAMRSLYGNLGEVPTEYSRDCKIISGYPVGWQDWPLLSTGEQAMYKNAGRFIEDRFPDICRYEEWYRRPFMY